VEGRGGGIEDPTWEVNPGAETLRGYVESALHEGSWHHVAFHGVGSNCEWGGPVDEEAFTALLDYLVEKRDQIWTGTHTEVHKYDQERKHASVTIHEVSSQQICLDLCSATIPTVYDYPLTLVTEIPGSWKTVLVTQGGHAIKFRFSSGRIQFDVIPGRGSICIRKA
jgi:hypothetical protein